MEDGQSAVFSVTIPAQGEPATSIRVVDSGNTEALHTGTVAGVATSMETGGAIAGARISAPGTDYATTTSADGSFELELPRGSYSLRIAHPEYGNREVGGVVAAPGLAANLDLRLSVAGDSGSIEEVVADTIAGFPIFEFSKFWTIRVEGN
ncbi:carboxypeptidase-like regulatory domain-containing protein [Fodinibius sp.]|uniref:carboxypeptidase-like regulatory domain-containing protein n=1 Tax=Fodinibius sp. TaxID=1872440 RepID=UPI002ACEA6F1|nr:carboxypeptidase-like regulatory domain-containing protein [Fodinibius sp.]MDZ7658019.1 carboxypeptidase-like regulatory domain-containing protein [Fodinibius sp.]